MIKAIIGCIVIGSLVVAGIGSYYAVKKRRREFEIIFPEKRQIISNSLE